MKKNLKINYQEAGKCPKCGSDSLDYTDEELDGEQIAYEFTCDDCGITCKEWYSLHYVETIIEG